MTRTPFDDVPTDSAADFEVALTAVVEKAVESGVDVRGAWEFETRVSTHDWEVEIIELAQDFDDGQ